MVRICTAILKTVLNTGLRECVTLRTQIRALLLMTLMLGSGALQASAAIFISATPLLPTSAVPTIAILEEGDSGDGFINAEEALSVVIEGTTSNIEADQLVSLTISVSDTELNGYAIVLGDGHWQSNPINIAVLEDGVLTIKAEASNSFGVSAGAASNTVNLDTEKPMVTIDAISRSANSLPTLSGGTDQPDTTLVSVTDLASGELLCTAEADQSSWRCEPAPMAAKIHHIEASVMDRAGNVGLADITFEIDFDLDDDGIPDIIEAGVDSDGDQIPNNLDLDSDGDGILDSTERGSEVPEFVIDLDGDLIADEVDISYQEGEDSNANGIADQFEPVDTDGDSVPDYLDLDSDNDSLFDVAEAGLFDRNLDAFADGNQEPIDNPRNSDAETSGDSEPDYRDLDSDDDGVSDLAGSDRYSHLNDGNGMVSDSSDSDGDGIADAVDGAVDQYGSLADSDQDGVADVLDLDDDNDGLLDSYELENGSDFDLDGIPNNLDLDSDNDGIPDVIEGFGNTFNSFDISGRIEPFVDENLDGADDGVGLDWVPVDTDGDGAPDHLDLDSDNDDIFDIVESGILAADLLDPNQDGQIDDLVDSDLDGWLDAVDTEIESEPGSERSDDEGSADALLNYSDLDGDGLPDYRDFDTDGDGYSDKLENGDFDGDGIEDWLQNDGGLDTGVTGYGSFNPLLLLLLALVPLFRLGGRCWSSRRVSVRRADLLVLPAVVCVGFGWSFESRAIELCYKGSADNCLYAGISAGFSEVDPEGVTNGWHTADDIKTGWQLYLGMPIDYHWFGEFSYSDLGAADIDNFNPNIAGEKEIDYVVTSAQLGYLLRPAGNVHNFFGKVGIANIETSSSSSQVGVNSVSDVQLSGSVGWLWQPLNKLWFGRAHFDVYDRDAHFIGVSLGYALGKQVGSRGSEAEDLEVSEWVSTENLFSENVALESVEPVEEVEAVESVPVLSSYFDSAERQAETCRMFEGALKGVQFEKNSSMLTLSAQDSLKKAIITLKRVPELIIEIQAHTDSQGSEMYNQWLSERRALSVLDYLEANGLDGYQLTSKGYGETQPIATNTTEKNRALNRRVQFQLINEGLCN